MEEHLLSLAVQTPLWMRRFVAGIMARIESTGHLGTFDLVDVIKLGKSWEKWMTVKNLTFRLVFVRVVF